jgi:hypothetical protein
MRVCHRFFEQALDAVRQVPGVTAVAFTSQLPLSGDSDVYGSRFENENPEGRAPGISTCGDSGPFRNDRQPAPSRPGSRLS